MTLGYFHGCSVPSWIRDINTYFPPESNAADYQAA